jgi:hypothetical protein
MHIVRHHSHIYNTISMICNFACNQSNSSSSSFIVLAYVYSLGIISLLLTMVFLK